MSYDERDNFAGHDGTANPSECFDDGRAGLGCKRTVVEYVYGIVFPGPTLTGHVGHKASDASAEWAMITQEMMDVFVNRLITGLDSACGGRPNIKYDPVCNR